MTAADRTTPDRIGSDPPTQVTPTPVMMQAITQSSYGDAGVLSLSEVDRPAPGVGEVRVRVHASSMNPADWHSITGTPFPVRLERGLTRPKHPIPGIDLAGIVDELGGGVTEFEVGDAVYGEVRAAYAEYAAVPADAVVPKPSRLDFAQAATMPVAGLTALQGLRDIGGIHRGHAVLVNGASGGVGTFAVQIAKAMGAVVTAVCSTRNLEMVRSIGADDVIDYTDADFTRSGPYDLILDCVGDRSVADCRRAMAPGGVYVAVGGPKRMSRLLARAAWMAIRSIGSSRKMRLVIAKARPADLVTLAEMADAGDIVPVIDRTYPLAGVPDAVRNQGAGHARGKTVIAIREG